MKWLIVLFLWVVAVVLAVLVLRRVRRGKPVVLAGRWSPRVVRMVVVVLVVLGVGEEARLPDASAAPAKTPIRSIDDQMPPLKVYHVQSWLAEHQENGPFAPGKRDLVRALTRPKVDEKVYKSAAVHAGRLGSKLGDLIRADLAARAAGRDPPYATAADLTAAL